MVDFIGMSVSNVCYLTSAQLKVNPLKFDCFGGWVHYCYLQVFFSNVCGVNFSLSGFAMCTKLQAPRLQEFSLGASDKDRCSGILEIFLLLLIILSCNLPPALMSQHYFSEFCFLEPSTDFVI